MLRIPKGTEVTATAPMRLDVGTFLDQPPIATVYESIGLHTATIAVSLRARVHLKAIDEAVVRHISQDHVCDYSVPLPLNGQHGLLNAIATHFQAIGLSIQCSLDVPPMSGLGGSSALAVALVASLLAVSGQELETVPFRHECAMRAFLIENGLYAPTGLQDQLAAAFGGVALHTWCPTKNPPYKTEQILDATSHDEIARRLVVAFTGEGRSSTSGTQKMFDSFSRGGCERTRWLETSDNTKVFATACNRQNWHAAIDALNAVNDVRCELVPSVATDMARCLRGIATEMAAGFSVAGAGEGGFVYALAKDDEAATDIATKWECALARTDGALVTRPKIASDGVLLSVESTL